MVPMAWSPSRAALESIKLPSVCTVTSRNKPDGSPIMLLIKFKVHSSTLFNQFLIQKYRVNQYGFPMGHAREEYTLLLTLRIYVVISFAQPHDTFTNGLFSSQVT